MSRPILYGMNNPLSDDPALALWPDPPGCTGHRIWRLCGEPEKRDYLRAFDRRNVLNSVKWRRRTAHRLGTEAWAGLRDVQVVVFGRDAAQALGVGWRRPEPLDKFVTNVGVEWWYLPHPSGRCHWYNDPLRWRMASALLTELMEEGLRDNSP